MRLCFIALCGIVSISLNLLLYASSASAVIFSHSLAAAFFLSPSSLLSLFFLPRLVLVTVPFSILSITSPVVPSSSRSFILHGRHRQFQNKTLFNYLNRLHFLGRIAQLFPHCIENKEKATMNVIWS